ncbi:FtsX-like permease family protein [Marinilabiliaceae bacterium JC017]|nr:FtsX-like permease family protein [Marinilabiliaceae bacterium JC017]
MNIINLIKIALNAMKRNKFRAFLTMLGVIIGVASVIAMLSIGQGSKESIREQISSMGTNMVIIHPGQEKRGGVSMGNTSSQSLEGRDLEAIMDNCPSISAVSPEVNNAGQVVFGANNCPTTIFGGNENYTYIKKIEVENGHMFTTQEIKSAAKVCLIGQTVVDNLFGEGADPVGQTIRFKKIPFKIIGVLEEKGQNTFGQDQDDLLLAPYTTVQKRITATTYFRTILASAISEEAVETATTEIEEALRISHRLRDSDENDFNIRTQQELVTTFSSVSDLMLVLLGAIATISLIVGGIGIMNIMYVSVTERTREIGLRMAIGGKSKYILMQFLCESILLSITGGMIGIALGIGTSSIVKNVMGWPTIVTTDSILLSFLFCSFIGIFFGWYPARKAAALDPINALRHE